MRNSCSEFATGFLSRHGWSESWVVRVRVPTPLDTANANESVKMFRWLFRLVLVASCWSNLSPLAAVAQDERSERGSEAPERPELETDRDAFTPATSTVGYRLTTFESSYSFIDNKNVADTHSLPELLVRYGVSDRIELRLGWNFEVGGAGDVVSGAEGAEAFAGKIERDSQMLYGLKAEVSEQAGWIPRSAVTLQGFTPTSGEATATDVTVGYGLGWEFANNWRLDSAVRYGTEHGTNDTFNQWAPSVVLRVPFFERWHAHIEYFGIFSQGAERDFSRAFISPGMHYLLTENLELGVRLGWGITEDAAKSFTNVGIGWRF